jgi:hypothetical protein
LAWFRKVVVDMVKLCNCRSGEGSEPVRSFDVFLILRTSWARVNLCNLLIHCKVSISRCSRHQWSHFVSQDWASALWFSLQRKLTARLD